jgi:hypothetical protein
MIKNIILKIQNLKKSTERKKLNLQINKISQSCLLPTKKGCHRQPFLSLLKSD